jgi:hypothetical protein
MALKGRVISTGRPARLVWAPLRDYGFDKVNAAEFTNDSGDLLHLEHRLESETSVVNWTTRQPIRAVARRIGQLAGKDDEARIVVDEHLRTVADPRKLGSIVSHLGGIRLMRLDRSDTSVVWEREAINRGGLDDLTVQANSWTDAEKLAIHMGAALEEGEVTRLAATVPRLAPLPPRAYEIYPSEIVNGDSQVAMPLIVPGTGI